MQSLWFLVNVYWESASISQLHDQDFCWAVLLSRSISREGACPSKSCSWHLWLCWWWLHLHLQRMLPDAATGCWYASMCFIKYKRGLLYYGACVHVWNMNGDVALYEVLTTHDMYFLFIFFEIAVQSIVGLLVCLPLLCAVLGSVVWVSTSSFSL